MPALAHSRTLAALLLAACAGRPAAAPAPLPGGDVPFEVSSVGTRYALRGRFVGAVQLTADSLVVRLTDAAAQVAGSPAAGAAVRYQNVRLAAAVGTPSGSSWDVRARSEPVLLRGAVSAGEAFAVDTGRFVIRRPRGLDPRRDWLVFVFAARDARTGESFTTYACAAAPLLGPRRGSDARAAGLRTAYESTC